MPAAHDLEFASCLHLDAAAFGGLGNGSLALQRVVVVAGGLVAADGGQVRAQDLDLISGEHGASRAGFHDFFYLRIDFFFAIGHVDELRSLLVVEVADCGVELFHNVGPFSRNWPFGLAGMNIHAGI